MSGFGFGRQGILREGDGWYGILDGGRWMLGIGMGGYGMWFLLMLVS